ncbi:Rhodanese-related sulfurtransferase (fragment) [Vibrio nigripulchritudo SOn1]|uniref:Rhodanese-related sulfurtransferase n=1 Tax=Vibrio nigripulchritudo SOn1 TaxID=1238450 RepID=A0AAV2W112_9VIBR
MRIENGVRILAGGMIIISLLLTHWVDPNFVWLTAFVGINLVQSAMTGFCPAAHLLKKLGAR